MKSKSPPLRAGARAEEKADWEEQHAKLAAIEAAMMEAAEVAEAQASAEQGRCFGTRLLAAAFSVTALSAAADAAGLGASTDSGGVGAAAAVAAFMMPTAPLMIITRDHCVG